jgi:alanine dehydrogenase
MIVKVKEPQADERAMLREGQILFTYLHLAPDPEQTNGLLKSGAVCIAYETVTDARGGLPLLAPMSEVAGRMAVQVGAHALEKAPGRPGVLLGGVPGVPAARVVILGGGVVGTNAAHDGHGPGRAGHRGLDRNLDACASWTSQFGNRDHTVFSSRDAIEEAGARADLVIGAVLVPGASAPKLVTRDMLSRMKPGSVIVDVAIDQGGCFETSHATTHADPTYVVDGVVHYCVANMPGAVARTSTFALNNATLPFVLALADKGWRRWSRIRTCAKASTSAKASSPASQSPRRTAWPTPARRACWASDPACGRDAPKGTACRPLRVCGMRDARHDDGPFPMPPP